MNERYVSEQLAKEAPRSLLNFIWYLWETYCDPAAGKNQFMLQPCTNGQRIVIDSTSKTVEQDFGTAIYAVIVIQKDGEKYYMSRR